jgi:hypothetical protein
MALKAQNNKPGDVPIKASKKSPWAQVDVARGAEIYENANVGTIINAIVIAAKNGDALLFGCTSDGGAVSITWLHDKQRDKLYPTSVEALEDALEALIQHYH